MILKFTKDYLSYPKGRVLTITETAGQSLIDEGVAEKATKDELSVYTKERIAKEKKCEECKKDPKNPCKECEGTKNEKGEDATPHAGVK